MKNIKVLTLHHAPTKKKEVNWPYLFCARKCLEYIPENFRDQSIAVGEEFFVISLCLWSVNASLKNDLELLSKNSHFEKGPLCSRGTYTATTSACMHPMCVPPEIFKNIAIWNDVIFNQIILWCGFIKNLLASFCWLIIGGWRLFIPQSQGEWGYWLRFHKDYTISSYTSTPLYLRNDVFSNKKNSSKALHPDHHFQYITVYFQLKLKTEKS